MDTLIDVKNLRKKFCDDLKRSMVYGINDIACEILGLQRNSGQLRKREFWALNDISFSIKQGDSIGLIGSNGAGKSTLLRIISGLIKPDFGSVRVRGRVAPLIALGAGFNPILTGRENIFVNMAILGLTNEEIRQRFDEVVDFSGLEHALDIPVQTYSSGMAARLGFSCAVFTHPDILLIDEVLAVGDLKFRAKCYRKLADLKRGGVSFVIVSHNSQTILSVCEHSLFLKRGNLMYSGSAHEGIRLYESDIFGKESVVQESGDTLSMSIKDEKSTTGIDLIQLSMVDGNGQKVDSIMSGGKYGMLIRGYAHDNFDDVGIAMIIRELNDEYSNAIFADSRMDGNGYCITKGYFEIIYWMTQVSLKNGLYSVKLNINQNNIHMFDTTDMFRIRVVSDDKSLTASSFYQSRSWTFSQSQDDITNPTSAYAKK